MSESGNIFLNNFEAWSATLIGNECSIIKSLNKVSARITLVDKVEVDAIEVSILCVLLAALMIEQCFQKNYRRYRWYGKSFEYSPASSLLATGMLPLSGSERAGRSKLTAAACTIAD